jgi:transcriptional regulatory protein GAL4
MGRSPPESVPEQLKACLECQKRKSRCTGELPCAFCHKARRTCVYTPRPQRTPLTRKNLDAAEQRCQKLASMLKSLNPDVDIESLLKDSETSVSGQLAKPSSPGTSQAAPTGSSNRYEWHEDPLSADEHEIQSPRDGMALLPTNPSDSGYLGMGQLFS